MEWTEKPKQIEKENSEKSSAQVNHIEQNQNVLIATALLRVNNKNGQFVTVSALIDPDSQSSLITESVVQALKLNRRNICVEVSGLGATKAGTASNKVDITIAPHFTPNFKLKLEALTQQLPSKQTGKHQVDLQELTDPTYNIPGPIDMIIGADSYCEIILSGIKRVANNSLIAQKSQLR